MIKTLRQKVFWSILISAAGVLLAILIAINILGLIQTASKKESILDTALTLVRSGNGNEKGHGNGRGDGKGRSELLRSVSEGELGVFMMNADGIVDNKMGCAAQMDDQTIKAIAEAALADKDGQGSINGWEYKAFATELGTGISILDAASLRKESLDTALLSLALFILACALFAFLAFALAKAIVKPVDENMQMQKRFVADASHELKTPLAVIDANASVLEQSIGQNKWLDYIKEQSARMSGLVNELLMLSNIEEAKEKGEAGPKEPFDAAEAVMAAALPFESVAFEQGLLLETDAPDGISIKGNRREVEQLAAILIDNAIKHSSEGGRIQVSLDRAMSMARLRVINPGEDIPTEAIPHLFDRFYKVDESRTYKDKSYGLGLAIAKGLAEKNGGSISVTSGDNITEFTLLLPAE
ncbi:MAG: hypothetical protein IK152_00545 [Lachnospiraceae bacterium]|nr:hypothetical protein [Lachnospiraceae bacterium]